MKAIDWLWSILMAPISPKNLRLSAILISIYQLLIASVGLFMALLGLAHAKQMKVMLAEDIADQDDLGPYYENRPYKNQMSLYSASTLASITEFILYIATGVTSIYFLACVGLFVGVFKNRSILVAFWLILDFIGIIVTVILMFNSRNKTISNLTGGKWHYWILCLGLTLFDITIWYIIYSFFISLREINKLTEIATVAIPCPAPGSIPYHYRKENMHLGSNGYKHVLYDNNDVENQKI